MKHVEVVIMNLISDAPLSKKNKGEIHLIIRDYKHLIGYFAFSTVEQVYSTTCIDIQQRP